MGQKSVAGIRDHSAFGFRHTLSNNINTKETELNRGIYDSSRDSVIFITLVSFSPRESKQGIESIATTLWPLLRLMNRTTWVSGSGLSPIWIVVSPAISLIN